MEKEVSGLGDFFAGWEKKRTRSVLNERENG